MAAPSYSLLLYLSGGVVLAAGLMTIWNDLREAQPAEKLVVIGPLLFAIPLAVFGAQHFVELHAIMSIMPAWIPGHLFFVVLVGICLMAAALSIATRIQSALAAFLTAVMFWCFELLMIIPGAVMDAHNRFGWIIVLREFSFSFGALAIAASHARTWSPRAQQAAVTVTRVGLGIAITIFGVEHLLHPASVPGVPLERITPAWIPGHAVWGYVNGVVYVVAGLLLLANRKPRSAALAIGVMLLVLIVAVYLPITIAQPLDIGNAIDYLFDTLLLCGSVLSVAAIQPSGADTRVPVAAAARP